MGGLIFWDGGMEVFSAVFSCGCRRCGPADSSGISTGLMKERTAIRKTATITSTAINTARSPKLIPGLGMINLLECDSVLNEPSLQRIVKRFGPRPAERKAGRN